MEGRRKRRRQRRALHEKQRKRRRKRRERKRKEKEDEKERIEDGKRIKVGLAELKSTRNIGMCRRIRRKERQEAIGSKGIVERGQEVVHKRRIKRCEMVWNEVQECDGIADETGKGGLEERNRKQEERMTNVE